MPSRAILVEMKQGIHPEYVDAHVRCTCGNEFDHPLHRSPSSTSRSAPTATRSTPGKQKLVDSGGRVERFRRRAARRAASG